MAIKFSTLHFMIVEDNRLLFELLSNILESLNVKRISYAKDGSEALEKFREDEHDIILADWDMEPMDGIQFVKELRTDESLEYRDVPIILITGFAQEPRIVKARDAGVTEYIIKPFTAENVIKKITSVINNPRDFIETDNYAGPDRRRRKDPNYSGPFRRYDDKEGAIDFR